MGFAIFSIIWIALAVQVVEASPLFVALGNNDRKVKEAAATRDPASFGKTYILYFAPIPNGQQTSLPEARPVAVPVTLAATEARSKIAGLLTSQVECFVPEISIITVTSVSEQKVTGYLNWHPDYTKEKPRCRDRMQPNDQGLCSDKQAATIPPCTNGSIVTLDFSEAIGPDGQPASSTLWTTKIKETVKR